MKTFECTCSWCGKELVRKYQHPSRNVRLHFCDLKCKGDYQRTKKPVTREWLFEHYVTKRLDTTQIGHIVKRDPKSVWNWLKDFGIPTRPRGHGMSSLRFKKGEVSGSSNPFYGRKHTAEFRKRMSERAKAEGRVPFKKENGPPWKGKGGAVHPAWKGGITPERQAFYATKEWRAAARTVRRRDKKSCRLCGRKKKDRSDPFDIHHIVGFACVELRSDPDNLVYLCEPCHYWVHGNENTDRLFLKEIPCR